MAIPTPPNVNTTKKKRRQTFFSPPSHIFSIIFHFIF